MNVRHRLRTPSCVHARLAPGGFSLLELLTAIVALGILLSLSLPALQRMREQSRAVKCSANLRDLSAAVALYTQENNGLLPTTRYSPGRAVTRSADLMWPEHLWKYVYPEREYKRFAGPNLPASLSDTAFECPQALYDRQMDSKITNVRSYGMNHYLGDGLDSTSDAVATLADPSAVCLLADCKNESQLRPHTINSRHHDRFNVLYVDGHVELREYTTELSNLRGSAFWGTTPK